MPPALSEIRNTVICGIVMKALIMASRWSELIVPSSLTHRNLKKNKGTNF